LVGGGGGGGVEAKEVRERVKLGPQFLRGEVAATLHTNEV